MGHGLGERLPDSHAGFCHQPVPAAFTDFRKSLNSHEPRPGPPHLLFSQRGHKGEMRRALEAFKLWHKHTPASEQSVIDTAGEDFSHVGKKAHVTMKNPHLTFSTQRSNPRVPTPFLSDPPGAVEGDRGGRRPHARPGPRPAPCAGH